MNKHVKKKWLKALRSGKYGKGRGYLGYPEDNFYCCLGVLAEEMAPEFCRSVNGEIVVDGDSVMLPDDLAILFDLPEMTQNALAGINDSYDTFDLVIKYIEENL